MTRWRPFAIWYSTRDGELLVHMAGRSDQGKRVNVTVKSTRPYFFVPAGEGQVTDQVLEVEPSCLRTLVGDEPVDKLYVRTPFDIPKIRDGYSRHYEADIPYERRMRYEHGIKECIESPEGVIFGTDIKPSPGPTIQPRICVIDIETLFSLNAKEADKPVTAIAAWDSKTDRYASFLLGKLSEAERAKVGAYYQQEGYRVQTIECSDEKELFAKYTGFLHTVQPDLLTGWNYTKFDHEYLTNRATKMGYDIPDWGNDRTRKMFAVFDLMDGYERQYEGELESKSLDFVAQLEGIGKKNKDGMTVLEMFERHKDRLLMYNTHDVFLAKGVERKKNLVSFFMRLAALAGSGIEDVLSSDRIVNNYMFHRLMGKAVQKSNRHDDRPREQIKGAIVFAPSYGLFDNVAEVDNSGEYAAVIRTGNFSPETIDPPEGVPYFQAPSGHRYRKEPRGAFPLTSDELTAEREVLKKGPDREQERVVKEVNLSLYGTLASPHYRNHDQRIGADITDIARRHVQHNRAFVVEEPFAYPLYGDTDSTLFHYLDKPSYEEVEARAKDMTKRLNATYDAMALDLLGAEQHFFSVKLEHVYDRFLQTGVAKRYACIYRDPKGKLVGKNGITYTMKVRGFEVRRSNAAPFTRRLQREVLEMALLGSTQEELLAHIKTSIGRLRSGEVPMEEVGIPSGIQQDAYGRSMPIHVRAAKWSNDHLGTTFGQGSKPLLFFGGVRGLPRTDAFCLEWGQKLPPGADLNWNRTLERTVFLPLKDILATLGISTSMFTNEVQPADEFF